MIYFDNAATSYPKPFSVINSSINAIKNYSFNSGRGGYKQSLNAAEKIFSVREKIGTMFGFDAQNIVFTKNCTEALNMAIKGCVKSGDHIVVSSLEHNSVTRVVEHLSKHNNVEYSVAKFSFDEEKTINNFKNAIKENTKAVVCMHSSNVFGVCFPIKKIGELCKNKGIVFIVDAAQGAGVVDINAKRDNIDILCAPGHKCLFGNMGTGFMAVKQNIFLQTLFQGGTGSESLLLSQPSYMPDRFESGTLNNSGIISVGSGIDYINKVGMDNIYKHELELAQYVYDSLNSQSKFCLYTPKPLYSKSMPIISFNVEGYSSEHVAQKLAENNICTRAGYHCSPFAHKHFGTMQNGTIRVSFGPFNTEKECNSLINVVKNI